MLKGKSDCLLSVIALAERLGCSTSFVYSGVEYGIERNGSRVKIPHYRVGCHIRFDYAEVREFLKFNPD